MKRKGNVEAPARDPLLAVPVKPEEVEEARTNKGTMCLRRKIAVNKGMLSKVVKLLHLKRYKQLDLDEQGLLFWELVDGRLNLKKIARRMNADRHWENNEIEKAVMLYTKALMLRGFLKLKIDAVGIHDTGVGGN